MTANIFLAIVDRCVICRVSHHFVAGKGAIRSDLTALCTGSVGQHGNSVGSTNDARDRS